MARKVFAPSKMATAYVGLPEAYPRSKSCWEA
jgi:hypothetical protein